MRQWFVGFQNVPRLVQNILAVASIVMLFLQVARIAILEKRSTTTKKQSLPHVVDERPDM
jgi:hypothetical protein